MCSEKYVLFLFSKYCEKKALNKKKKKKKKKTTIAISPCVFKLFIIASSCIPILTCVCMYVCVKLQFFFTLITFESKFFSTKDFPFFIYLDFNTTKYSWIKFFQNKSKKPFFFHERFLVFF